MPDHEQEFLLNLYNKLWENMDSKEGRLWSYLSIYGAAVALTFTAGHYGGIELYTLIIALALTMWAVLIVLNANWWYYRNLLIVSRIENKFSATLAGIIPKFYGDVKYNFDRLYRGSLLVLVIIAMLLYAKNLWEYGGGIRRIHDMWVASWLGVIYCFLIFAITFCVGQNETYLSYFYRTKRALLLEGGGDQAAVDEVASQERNSVKSISWAIRALPLLAIAMVFFDVGAWRNQMPCGWLLGLVVTQISSIVLYWLLVKPPDGKWWQRRIVQWSLFNASLLITLAFLPLGLRGKLDTTKTSTEADLQLLEDQLQNLRQSVTSLEEQGIRSQRSLLASQLSGYMPRTEATQQFQKLLADQQAYLTKEDAKRLFITKEKLQDSSKRSGAGGCK